MATLTAVVRATGTLTLSGQPLNTETVVVGSKTYTFQDTLTDVDGNVKIGATAAASIVNLYNAINLTGTAGTNYATSMTKNKQVEATSYSATTLVVKAGVVGTVGNLIPSTETLTNGAWGAALLASGAGDSAEAIREIIQYDQVNAAILHSFAQMGFLPEQSAAS